LAHPAVGLQTWQDRTMLGWNPIVFKITMKIPFAEVRDLRFHGDH